MKVIEMRRKGEYYQIGIPKIRKQSQWQSQLQ